MADYATQPAAKAVKKAAAKIVRSKKKGTSTKGLGSFEQAYLKGKK